jgi:hypothetical protein
VIQEAIKIVNNFGSKLDSSHARSTRRPAR